MNKFDEMREAVREARTTLAAADACVETMAALCAGRLKRAGVDRGTLRKLKDELRAYNPHTNTWR